VTRRWFLRGLGAVAVAVSVALPTFELPAIPTFQESWTALLYASLNIACYAPQANGLLLDIK
jgi:hypothetical protein